MRSIKKGATSQSVYIEVLDSTSTTGGRKTGLAFNTASLTGYYVRNQGSATAITLATLAAANSAWSSGGFKEVDATNMPGVYRLDVPDASVAAGSGDDVTFTLKGATGMAQVSTGVQLLAWDPQDTVRGGLTALPNATVSGVGGLLTAPTTANVGLADLSRILGTALTETAGQIAAAFKKWFDVAAPVGTVNSIPNATAGAAGGLFIAGTNAATTITTALTTTFTGNLTGSVASVTGAVGSVTGAVGSVTGAVGSVTGNVGGNVVGSVASVTARVTANTDQLNGDATSAANIAKTTRAIGRGTCTTAGSTTTLIATSAFLPVGVAANTDQFAGRVITFDADTTTTKLRGQSTIISSSSAAAAPVFTVTAITIAPVDGDTFSVT